ncbi:hypothetical protein EPD60_01110 [Flaviaesturariibacter flavus]|uniref:Uncharacterized protein n=1 Tax=Flaviaesturariibacter flavus TaxID=2502780 RepID=A0A4R1BPB3_9BACT|nr:hypothetical protein [Flaviaesturariibacter flavus]TCJ19045.1 hypothetical protein EPD60_01110 [Flaviaesturariibacter flavus]
MPFRLPILVFLFLWSARPALGQQDSTAPAPAADTALRIVNLAPNFTVHVDSVLDYRFESNRDSAGYYWFLRNAPVGVRINRSTGQLSFRADRSYFLSGRLRYDQNYKVQLGLQSLSRPSDRVDTSFTILFYNTEIVPSRLRPGVYGNVYVNEGDTLRFPVFCETGSFPIESVLTQTSQPLGEFSPVTRCGDFFRWAPPYSFVGDNDSAQVRVVQAYFIGATRTQQRDTAQVRIVVRHSLNYPLAREQYTQLVSDLKFYILRLKFTFLVLDKSIRKTKHARTGFDLTAASTALTGTVLSTSKDEETKRTGAIMPGVGLVLTPIKEATAPARTTEQSQATLVRASIKRLEYVLQDNSLLGDKDPGIAPKINKLREELKQSQLQLIDVPIEVTNNMGAAELDAYFNSPKVNKKYRLRRK